MTTKNKRGLIAAALLGASQLFTGIAYGETTISRDTPIGTAPDAVTNRPAVPTRATCTQDLADPNVKQDVYIYGVGGGGLIRASFGYIQPDPEKPEIIEYTGCLYQKINQRPVAFARAFDTATAAGREGLQAALDLASTNHVRMCGRPFKGPKPPECG
jgi:hypothetical protein